MTTKKTPTPPVRRLAAVRADVLDGGEPTIGDGHRRLIDAIADRVAADAAERAIAKAKKKGRTRRPESR